YDTPYPEPLHATRPLADQFAVAMLLTPQAAANSLGSIALALGNATQTMMQHADLEIVRRGIPAARSLPLLRALATGTQEDVQLEYVNGRTLHVAYLPK